MKVAAIVAGVSAMLVILLAFVQAGGVADVRILGVLAIIVTLASGIVLLAMLTVAGAKKLKARHDKARHYAGF